MKFIVMKFVLTSLVIFCLASCHSAVDPSVNIIPSLIGTWSWTSTSGGLMPDATPATEGYSMTLILTAGLKYTMYKNAIVVRQGSYRTEKRGEYNYMIFDSDAGLLITQSSANYLALGSSAADGPAYQYVRVKN